MIDYETIISSMEPPKSSMTFGGILLEEAIPGYRTSSITGRDSLSFTISERTSTRYDGAIYKNRQTGPRELIVTYAIVTNTRESHRAAFNRLHGILFDETAQEVPIIFNDEPDFYWIGTVSELSQEQIVDDRSSSGQIKIHCSDPRKYSVEEFEVDADENGEFIIDYDGTYKTYPKLYTTFFKEDNDGETSTYSHADCGYVVWLNDKEKIIQLGDPDETDTNSKTKSNTLVNQVFKSWDSQVQNYWAQNQGMNSGGPIATTPHRIIGTIGLMQYGGGVAIGATGFGAVGENPQYWHGPSISRTFESSENWRARWKLDMAACYAGLKQISNIVQKYGYSSNKNTQPSTWSTEIPQISSTNKYLWNYAEITYAGVTSEITKDTTKHVIFEYNGRTIKSLKDLYCTTNLKTAPIDSYFSEQFSQPDKENKYIWNYKVIELNPKDNNDHDTTKNTTKVILDQFTTTDASGDQKQIGAVQCIISQGNEFICGVSIWKSSTGNKATLQMYLRNTSGYKCEIDISEFNKWFGWTKKVNGSTTQVPIRWCKINKKGNEFVFDVAGLKRTLRSDEAASFNANTMTFWFGVYGNAAPLYMMGVEEAQFIKDHYADNQDIPNKFGVNDELEVDCSTGDIKLNNLSTPSLGALGNDWEEFCLTPGLNQLTTAYSDWVPDAYKPTFKLKYRKVYL